VLHREELLKINELRTKSPFPWALDIVFDWSLIGFALFLDVRFHGFLTTAMVMLILGNRQHALAVLGHEGAHYTLHANRRLNDFLSNLFCFWPLLLTTEGYRALHFMHHKNTGTASDPELLHKKSRAPQWDLPLDKKKVVLYALKDLVGYAIDDFWIILMFSRPKNKRLLLPVAALHFVFIAACVAYGIWWIPCVWYGSLPTTFMMFFRLRLWIEHQGTFGTQRVKLNPLEAALIAPHNIWYHWEHHEYPAVPYHKLKEARKILKGPEPISLKQLTDKLSKSPFMPSGAAIDNGGT
jgi:fatty acid desaturase